jgi:hypothetical protein
MNCAYCEAGISEEHTHEARVCIDCGNEVPAVDNRGRCVPCILISPNGILVRKILEDFK